MITIGVEAPAEAGAREILLDRAMGPDRLLKSSERLREGRLPAADLALAARKGEDLVGTVRLWHVAAGGCAALLLGPLAIDPDCQGEGIGSRLMRAALGRAALLGHRAVLLVGDVDYYSRFGFTAALTRHLLMPGPFDPRRFMALEFAEGALSGAAGMVLPTGAFAASRLVGADYDADGPFRLAA